MANLEIREEPLSGVQGAAILRLQGVLDQPTLGEFLSRLDAAREAGNVKLLLDMEGVSYANSTALGALVTQADAFRNAGGELVLFSPQPKVELVLDMLGLGALFEILPSADEACAYLKAGGAATAAPTRAPSPEPSPRTTSASAGAFPVRAECIGCGIALEFDQAGHYRCPRCSAVYGVGETGEVSGSTPRNGLPIEVTLTCDPQCLGAFRQFVGGLPAWEGFSNGERQGLERAIGEICDVIRTRAYGGDPSATFQVLLLCRERELALRVADHGQPLDATAFPTAAAYMTDFEHRPHPTRGNLLKMAKRPD